MVVQQNTKLTLLKLSLPCKAVLKQENCIICIVTSTYWVALRVHSWSKQLTTWFFSCPKLLIAPSYLWLWSAPLFRSQAKLNWTHLCFKISHSPSTSAKTLYWSLCYMTDIKILGKSPENLSVYYYDCLASDSVLKRQSKGKQNWSSDQILPEVNSSYFYWNILILVSFLLSFEV